MVGRAHPLGPSVAGPRIDVTARYACAVL